MKHSVAIGANRGEVFNRINLVAAAGVAQRQQVMDMDKAVANIAISVGHIEPANAARSSVMGNASTPRSGIALVRIHGNLPDCPISKSLRPINLIRRLKRRVAALPEKIAPNRFQFSRGFGKD